MNVALHPETGFHSINAISICTGGGGLDLGLELAIPGYRPVAYVEREAFACAHLVAAMEQGLLAPAPLWSDARTFPGRTFRGRVDCVVGGIPCQPHSVAGKRLGREDERDLWSPFRRILVQTGAWCALIENVPGMVTSGGLERVWRDLHRLGFAVEAGLFSAEEVGASHGRERLFILAIHQSALTGGGLADSDRERLQGQWADSDAQGRQDARDSDGQPMAHSGGGESEQRCRADEIGRRAGKTQQAGLGRRELAHADEPELRRLASAGEQPFRQQDAGNRSELADDPRGRGGRLSIQPWQQGQAGADVDWGGAGEWPIFAPGPGDELWRAVAALDPLRLPALSRHDMFLHACRAAGLNPYGNQGRAGGPAARVHASELQEIAQRTLRRMADGVAGPLDPDRIDALRMLGNGVVSLAGAHAVRTLGNAIARRHGAYPARFIWGAV